jgi:hypothetical protein
MTKQQIKAGMASVLAGVLAPAALLVPSVSAATVTWEGNGDGGFNSGLNWVSGGILVNGDTAVFPVSANNQMPNNDMVGLSLAKMVFSGEVTGSSSKSYEITGNGLTITSGIDAIMTGAGGDHAVKIDVTLGADATFKTSGVDTLQVGDTGTTLDLGANDLTLQPDGGSITLAGEIDGSGKIIINGNKTVNMLAKGATGYTGAVELTKGVIETSEETEGNFIINGGTLKGNSQLLGTVTMSAGSIAPGMSPGCLGMGDLTLTGGSYEVEINGGDACSGYDQTAVVGTVNLGSASALNVQRLNSYDPAVNTAFAIILNDGTDAVQGTFVDKADGSTFTVDGYTYQINYDAGDGNDVVLLVTATPSAPDTGVGTLLTSPIVAIAAAMAALAVIGGLKIADQKRK